MQLLSSLLLLGGSAFLSSQGPQLVTACAAYVGEVVERGLLLMLPPMDLLLVAAPHQAAPLMLEFMPVCKHPLFPCFLWTGRWAPPGIGVSGVPHW